MNQKKISFSFKELSVPGLIGVSALRLEAMAERFIFKPFNLSSASFRILALMIKVPEITPTEIMAYLGGTKSNVTQRLNFLIRSGLIETKRIAGGDKRRIVAKMTPAGRLVFKKINRYMDKNKIHVERFFTSVELENFYKFISKLNQGLDKCESHLFNLKYEK